MVYSLVAFLFDLELQTKGEIVGYLFSATMNLYQLCDFNWSDHSSSNIRMLIILLIFDCFFKFLFSNCFVHDWQREQRIYCIELLLCSFLLTFFCSSGELNNFAVTWTMKILEIISILFMILTVFKNYVRFPGRWPMPFSI